MGKLKLALKCFPKPDQRRRHLLGGRWKNASNVWFGRLWGGAVASVWHCWTCYLVQEGTFLVLCIFEDTVLNHFYKMKKQTCMHQMLSSAHYTK